MPTFLLVRHAKAEPHRPADHTRALAPRGRADAAALGKRLRGLELRPDRAVVSSSTRTRQTWQLMGVDCEQVLFDARLYDASWEDLLHLASHTPADVDVLLLVGHNPAVERLAWELDPSDAARSHTDTGMSTSGLAMFSVDDWSLTDARLTQWWSPRDGEAASSSP